MGKDKGGGDAAGQRVSYMAWRGEGSKRQALKRSVQTQGE